MDREIEVITLEDNFDYVILMEISMNGDKYIVLSKEDDFNVVVIRKIIIENGNEYLTKVSTDVENKVKERFVQDFVSLK